MASPYFKSVFFYCGNSRLKDSELSEILNYTDGVIRAQLEKSNILLVDGVSFSLREGESLALIGETGSGKTIIAQSIMGVLPENVSMSSGSIDFCGAPLPSGRRLNALLGVEIVYIPQNGHEFLNPPDTVGKQIYDSLKKLGIAKSDRKRIACEKLSMAGFERAEEILGKYSFQLSGGMAQRVAIALALCSDAKLLIADEPTNGLDEENKKQFMKSINLLFPKTAKLIITHDISLAALCDRIMVLCKGKMMDTAESGTLLKHTRHPYTGALLGSLVENGMQETPNIRNGKAFCPFYRRCTDANDLCVERMQYHKKDGMEWWCSRHD